MARLAIVLLHLPSVVVVADAFRLPLAAWRRSGIPRPAWVAIQVLLGAVAAVVYVVRIRPRVVAALDPPALP